MWKVMIESQLIIFVALIEDIFSLQCCDEWESKGGKPHRESLGEELVEVEEDVEVYSEDDDEKDHCFLLASDTSSPSFLTLITAKYGMSISISMYGSPICYNTC